MIKSFSFFLIVHEQRLLADSKKKNSNVLCFVRYKNSVFGCWKGHLHTYTHRVAIVDSVESHAKAPLGLSCFQVFDGAWGSASSSSYF